MKTGDIFSLNGVTALITGASGGIGAHFARTIAAAGAKVALSARRLGPLQELAEELKKKGSEAVAVPMDISNKSAVEAGFAKAEQMLGTIQLLVNCSGVTATTSMIELDEERWDAILDTNLKGAWLCSKEFSKRLIAKKEPGVVINVASVLGLRVAGQVGAYSASKAALIHLTKSLALELARYSIRVNALAPGYIATDLNREFLTTPAGEALVKRIPQRRLGQLEDLDGPLLLLASKASGFMTGAVVAVDGGHLVSSL